MKRNNDVPESKFIQALLDAIPRLPSKLAPRAGLKAQMIQIIVETGWELPSDFNIDYFANLHTDWIRRGAIPANRRNTPFYQLLRVIQYVDDAGLTQNMRHIYMMWCESAHFASMSFEQFRSSHHNYSGMCVHGRTRERVQTKAMIEDRLSRQYARRIKRGETTKPISNTLIKITQSSDCGAPERYFAALSKHANTLFRRGGWINNPTPYPGRDHIIPVEYGKIWFDCMSAFMKYRAHNKGFESTKDAKLALHLLADYIFAYLPWWCELNPDANLKFPKSPKDFLRYLFVSRTEFHEDQEAESHKLPKSLLEMLPLRRPHPETRNTTIAMWHSFFDFIRLQFEENEEIAGRHFLNPIKTNFDKVKTSPLGKTNKVPFAEDIFPYIVLYSQAVEAFGEYLMQRAYLENTFEASPTEAKYGYDTQAWGYVPTITYRGKLYPVYWIPNLYLVVTRLLHSNPPGEAGIYVSGRKINQGSDRIYALRLPHLTVIRMLMGMIETGIRGQGMQWLDRRTWDRDMSRRPLADLYTWQPHEMFTFLYVNTDKTKAAPWSSFISWRVRRSLLSEQRFQESLAEPDTHTEVAYEHRANSRFAPVVPLFRSHISASPYSDKNYAGRWEDFLIGFMDFYNGRAGSDSTQSEPIRFVTLEPTFDEPNSTVRVLAHKAGIKDGERLFCPLRYNCQPSPHVCRSTYATLKDGDLEVSEVAAQLGHENEVTTNYYQIPSATRVKKKLEASERRMLPGIYAVDGKSAAYLHTENPNSAARIAFERNRDKAITDFGFVPGVTLWSTSELDEKNDTIALLRESPSNVIRWHPTHVCPVGNQCPSDIVIRIGGYYRCGLCPLAAKHIDHLPAIAAKKNELKERVRITSKQIQALSERDTCQSAIDSLHRNMQLDTKELMGWVLSTEILHDKLNKLGTDVEDYHVDQPELVRRHLELVTRNVSESGFFLQRIADSNAYPMLESSEVRARAAKYIRIILAQAGQTDDAALLELEPYSELAAFASLIKPMAAAKNFQLSDLAAILDGSVQKSIVAAKHNGTILLQPVQ